MFNLSKEVNRLQQLKHDKTYGLPYKRKQSSPKIPCIDDILYDTISQQEGIAISRSFHNRSIGFGRRLSKVKGQKHHPGGGFAGCSIKGE